MTLQANVTLSEAKQWLRERFNKGSRCPCCDQYVKLYKRPLNASMAYVLIMIYRWNEATVPAGHPPPQWLHVPSFIAKVAAANPRRAAAVRGDWAKLRYWGLLAEMPGEREDGSARAGYYRITELGRDFVRGRASVATHIYLYNEQPVERPVATTLTIREALGKKFVYSELMGETT